MAVPEAGKEGHGGAVAGGLRVLARVPGPLRRPARAEGDDLLVWTPLPALVDELVAPAQSAAAAARAAVRRHDVTGVPGAFVLSDVLSARETAALVAAVSAAGFQADGLDGIGACVLLAGEELLGRVFARVAPLLPPTLAGGCALRGLNARLRCFRYDAGALYRPHIDGAWPGSGLTAGGALTDDAFGGARQSRLTFLVYLTGGFAGGATTFFLPSRARGAGAVDAFGVQPAAGHVLCFPHGDARGSLVHEGSPVLPGGEAKLIIRTDVLYDARPPLAAAAAAAAGPVV